MSEYLLASEAELDRLQLQARVWEPEVEAMLDRIRPQPGWSGIDLGCGAMGILGPLKRRVGSGRVVGVEADEKLLGAARIYCEREGLEGVELLHGDATNTGLPDGSFDLVHTRFLFPHVQPEALMGEMMRLAKPGGLVVAQEPDHSSWNFYPPCEAWPEFLDLMERALGLRGDINFGRRLYGFFREAGLQDVMVRTGVMALQNRHPYMAMTLGVAEAMRERMIAAGLVTAERLDELTAAVAACANDEARMQVTFTTIQVWGAERWIETRGKDG